MPGIGSVNPCSPPGLENTGAAASYQDLSDRHWDKLESVAVIGFHLETCGIGL